MLYVYCPRKSNGAFELVKALDAQRLRKFDGIDFWDRHRRHKLNDGDVVVCWGASVPDIEGVRVLNSAGMEGVNTVYTDNDRLGRNNIPTVAIYPSNYPRHSSLLYRLYDSHSGSDLLQKVTKPDYQVQKELLKEEYRIHSFDGRSIRAGIKVPREGYTACLEADWRPDAGLVHPWVRTFDAGWTVNYTFQSTPELRNLAHKSVKALGLTFGAVDIGRRQDGYLKVLSVKRAPSIEGGAVTAYVRAVTRWIAEDKKEDKDDTGGIGNSVPTEIEDEPDPDE